MFQILIIILNFMKEKFRNKMKKIKILLYDTDPDKEIDYNLEKIFSECGLAAEIVDASSVKNAEDIIKYSEKFDVLIASYNFIENDSSEIIKFIESHKDISTIFLDYQAHKDVSDYVRNNTQSGCIYKYKIGLYLCDVIRRSLKNNKKIIKRKDY